MEGELSRQWHKEIRPALQNLFFKIQSVVTLEKVTQEFQRDLLLPAFFLKKAAGGE